MLGAVAQRGRELGAARRGSGRTDGKREASKGFTKAQLCHQEYNAEGIRPLRISVMRLDSPVIFFGKRLCFLVGLFGGDRIRLFEVQLLPTYVVQYKRYTALHSGYLNKTGSRIHVWTTRLCSADRVRGGDRLSASFALEGWSRATDFRNLSHKPRPELREDRPVLASRIFFSWSIQSSWCPQIMSSIPFVAGNPPLRTNKLCVSF